MHWPVGERSQMGSGSLGFDRCPALFTPNTTSERVTPAATHRRPTGRWQTSPDPTRNVSMTSLPHQASRFGPQVDPQEYRGLSDDCCSPRSERKAPPNSSSEEPPNRSNLHPPRLITERHFQNHHRRSYPSSWILDTPQCVARSIRQTLNSVKKHDTM